MGAAHKIDNLGSNMHWLRIADTVKRLTEVTGKKYCIFQADDGYAVYESDNDRTTNMLVEAHDEARLADKLESFVDGFICGQGYDTWASVDELATSEGLHPETIRDDLKSGRLQGEFKQYRWRVRRADVPAWRQRRFEEDGRRKPKRGTKSM